MKRLSRTLFFEISENCNISRTFGFYNILIKYGGDTTITWLFENDTSAITKKLEQRWLKVNRKPVRAHAMDGAAFPHTIKVKYTIDGKDYICRKWIGAGNKVPDKGTTIKVTYCEDKPSKAIVEL